jgi:hypothetical protein
MCTHTTQVFSETEDHATTGIRTTGKNYHIYTDEILKTANMLAEEKELLMYCGARKLFTGPHFVEEISHYSITRLSNCMNTPLMEGREKLSIRLIVY